MLQIKIVEIENRANELFLGKEKIIHLACLSLLCQGHLLIEDRPGVGKTTLASIMAKLFGLNDSRIQFTNDLLPTDLLGAMIYDQQAGAFSFKHGPIFGNLVIADELNRATPKTQSAMLQCMEERSITVDGEHYPLPNPFIVMATQNPFQYVGTFELPESQIDRFFMGLIISYPDRQAESKLLMNSHRPRELLTSVPSILNRDEWTSLTQQIKQVSLSENIVNYILDIIEATRSPNQIFPDDIIPLSVRAGLDLSLAAKAEAFYHNRSYVLPDDVQLVASSILGHRLAGNRGMAYGQQMMEQALSRIAIHA